MGKKKNKKVGGQTLIAKSISKYFPVFVLPTFVAFCIGFIWPFIQGMYLSFCSFTIPKDAEFIGFGNYVKAFADPGFKHAFVYTAAFAVVSIVAINLLAFTVAYFLTQNIKGANIFRTVFFMPNLICGIVLGYIWSMIFDAILMRYDTFLLAKTEYGFWGLVILMCWQQVGYMMIIYIAGIQNIPDYLHEAAAIDGASPLQSLFHITVPMVMPSVTICTFLTLTNAFKLFDQNLALNGKAAETSLLALDIYKTFYDHTGLKLAQWHGIGQAKAVIFFILVAVIAFIQLRATKQKEIEQ